MLGEAVPRVVPSGRGGAAAVVGIAGSIPAARNFSSKEIASGTGAKDGTVDARVLKGGWA